MNLKKIQSGILVFLIEIFFLVSCNTDNFENISELDREPVIEPDYSGITIPANIAPLNFIILENGEYFKISATNSNGRQISVRSSDGIVRFPQKLWRKFLSESQGGKIEIEIFSEDKGQKVKKYQPFFMNVVKDLIDPYICYRLLYPGYESWSEIKIVQRSTGDFRESSIFENQLLEDNCVNCHSFEQNNPNRFLLHVRGSKAGTYFVDGKKATRRELRTKNMYANAVYPSWHPSGRYVAFSSNKIIQAIHMRPEKNNEFYDILSSLVIYDIERNEIRMCGEADSVKYMDTFPCWSPRGDFIYYCRTKQVEAGFDFRMIKYDLVRKSFDQVSGLFGKAEVVFNARAINKSASLPAISPDGQYLVFTLHDYGTFPVWHKEADLYFLDINKGKVDQMSLNSNETESYHSWSSNGKWIVFSSKRGDGLTARPYFVYFGSPDNVGKPFILPQKDPTLYKWTEKTFNRPEFLTGKIKTGPRDFERASKKESIKAIWTGKEQ
jgi:hypothetical protein